MKKILFIITLIVSSLSYSQQYFTFGPSFTYSRSEWFYQASPTNTDGNRQPVGWIKGIQSSPGVPLWSAFHMNTDTVMFGKLLGSGNSILGISSTGLIYRAPTYSFIDTNLLATRNWATQNFQSKLTGTTSQYVRGDGTLANFPTNNTAFTNGAGYITGYTETDPIWSASTWAVTTNNSNNWNTAFGWGNHSTQGYLTSSSTNVLTNKSGNISQWTNDLSYVTSSSLTTTLSGYATSSALTSGLSSKQETLVSGTNVKTVGGISILGSGDIPFPTAIGTNNASVYSSGTVYTLTTTSAKVTFGTTSPSITIPTAGTYLILPSIKIQYAGLTTLATQTCSFKVRRTNNTATDLPNATTSFNVPIVTLLTQTAGDCDIAPIIYTTTNNNDILEIWGNSGASVSVGSIQVGEASLVAIRIY